MLSLRVVSIGDCWRSYQEYFASHQRPAIREYGCNIMNLHGLRPLICSCVPERNELQNNANPIAAEAKESIDGVESGYGTEHACESACWVRMRRQNSPRISRAGGWSIGSPSCSHLDVMNITVRGLRAPRMCVPG